MADTLLSPLPPAECRRRLQAITDGPLAVRGTNSLMGRIGEHGATLRLRTRLHNPFQPILTLAWQAEGQGSRLSWRFATRRAALVVLAVWIALVLVLGTPPFLAALAAPTGPAALPGLVVPPLLVAGAALLLALGRLLARNDRPTLLAHLHATLDAAPPRSPA